MPVYLLGSPTVQVQTGLIGGAIPIDAMISAATTLGIDVSELDGLAALADIDTDEDGDPDAISAAFAFSAEAVAVR